jgi:orotidine-5'-phosphate decarboxylase
MITTLGFGTRLAAARDEHGALCVGIDPHAYLLHSWGLHDDAAGARDFGLRVVEASAGAAGIVKPQVSFFERFGAAGYAALEEVLAAARAAGLIVIADAKRGDIGSTMDAYAQAWLTPGSPLETDALTVAAYQGVGSLRSAIDLATEHGKGLFVLAATSNPEAAGVQRSVGEGGRSVAATVLDEVAAENAHTTERVGPLGVVLGSTVSLQDYGIDITLPRTPAIPVLAPGFGHQGGRLEHAPVIYGVLTEALVVSESRSILSAGPADLPEAIATRAAEVRAALA